MTEKQGPPGTLWGVGLGPGDPELVTVKAARVIGAADVIAYHSARHGRSIARSIAEPYLRDGQTEEHLVYPVTTETSDHPGGYAGAMEDFYRESAERIAAHLDAGRDVALLAEGDPLFYSSYMHMHTRLTERFDAVIVPGVTSVSAASAALVVGETVVPGVIGILVLGTLIATVYSIQQRRIVSPVVNRLLERIEWLLYAAPLVYVVLAMDLFQKARAR